MLYSDEERAVMAQAIQPNMRAKDISRQPFLAMLDEYFPNHAFGGARILDIGPGQCDFLDIVRERGALTQGCDFDPAVVRLGALRGHDMRLANLSEGWPYPDRTFDGIFCRGSFNAHWFAKPEALEAFLDGLEGALNTGAILWIAPFNSPVPGRDHQIPLVYDVMDRWTTRNGVRVELPDPLRAARYGVGYDIPLVELWVRP